MQQAQAAAEFKPPAQPDLRIQFQAHAARAGHIAKHRKTQGAPHRTGARHLRVFVLIMKRAQAQIHTIIPKRGLGIEFMLVQAFGPQHRDREPPD